MNNARKKQEVRSLDIRRSDNGGFIVGCNYCNEMSGDSYSPPDTLTFGSLDDVVSHVEDVFKERKGVSS